MKGLGVIIRAAETRSIPCNCTKSQLDSRDINLNLQGSACTSRLAMGRADGMALPETMPPPDVHTRHPIR